ncbi:protein kinase domain-containing protein [Streptomyces sp. MAR4 CNX-425]|uniref:serine/threonine-protein kinase n=1 Tax=Streptomyces sp. MAR4 CNX-425 TaxID=3406343 RepID=UPI003B50814A
MFERLPPGHDGHIGPYQLLARLGAGGMGEVYLARRPAPVGPGAPELAAVKTIRQDVAAAEEFRIRFRRETEAARAVTGPRTAAVLDAEVRAARPWLATEYVPGPALADAVRRCGPLPYDTVRVLGAELAAALEDIHAARVLHRDFKPGNVLLARGGPRVIDFGIARAFDATALTATGLVVGTPGFMSPEQVTGTGVPGPAGDVFCLGSVLCYAATGRSPFEDEEAAAVLFRTARADADLGRVPAPLRETLAACLRRDPRERMDARTLAAVLGAEPATAVPGGGFPWPRPVGELIATYERAAADIAAAAPAVPPPPHRAPPPAPAPDPPEPPRPGARWALTVGAAMAAVITVVLLATLLPGGGGTGGSGGSGGSGTGGTAAGASGGRTSPPAGGAAADRPPVVTDGGAAVRTGDFGDAALSLTARPPGWSPWNASLPPVDGCAMGGHVLVCTTGGGGAVGIDASDGTRLWTVPGAAREQIGSVYPPPAIEGDVAYLPRADGVTAVRLPAGERLWTERGNGEPVLGLAVLDGVLTVAQGPLDARTSIRALRTTGGRKELWSFRDDRVFGVAAVDGRVYLSHALAPGHGARVGYAAEVSAVGLRSGDRCGRARCRDFAVRDAWMLCWESPDLAGKTGATVLTADTLEKRGTIAPDVPLRASPVLGDDGTVLLDEDGRRLARYDLASGERLWDRKIITAIAGVALPAENDVLLLAGDRIMAAEGVTVHATPPGDPDGRVRRRRFDVEFNTDTTDTGPLLTATLVSGGVVYLVYGDGTAVSGYLPG